MLIRPVTVGEISTASTQASNATTTSGAREARFNRNEKPLVLLRPIMGSHPGEKVLLSRQFAVNAPYSCMYCTHFGFICFLGLFHSVSL